MRLVVILAVMLGGCRHQDGARPADQPGERTETWSLSHAEALCREVAARSAAEIEGLRAQLAALHVDFEPGPGIGWCSASAGGTWAIVPEGLHVVEGDLVEGSLVFVHVDPEGRRAELLPMIFGETELSGNFSFTPGSASLEFPAPVAFDYDGDSSPELITSAVVHRAEDSDLLLGRVWTMIRGAIGPYGQTVDVAVFGVRDADGDGRPDLIVHAPYATTATQCESAFSFTVLGPELLAHSLPDGSFSMSDEPARAFLRASCPAGRDPGPLPRREDGAVDVEPAVVQMLCARLRGAPAAELLEQLRRECEPPPPPDPDTGCGECSSLEPLADLIALDPPLVVE